VAISLVICYSPQLQSSGPIIYVSMLLSVIRVLGSLRNKQVFRLLFFEGHFILPALVFFCTKVIGPAHTSHFSTLFIPVFSESKTAFLKLSISSTNRYTNPSISLPTIIAHICTRQPHRTFRIRDRIVSPWVRPSAFYQSYPTPLMVGLSTFWLLHQ